MCCSNTLDVFSIGYLVPRDGFAGRVHSVFTGACNVDVGDMLLTIAAGRAGDGPALLRLAGEGSCDLRRLFDAGERIFSCAALIRTTRAALRLHHARVWRPEELTLRLPPPHLVARLRDAGRSLDRFVGRSRILRCEAAGTVAELANACRDLDPASAVPAALKLVGWGEGLTPAGDDFLVGLLAGLEAMASGDAPRSQLRGAIAASVRAAVGRTTRIAAHYLSLAADGHYNERLVRLRNALLAGHDWCPVEAALSRMLAVGATSGADTASGLLTGLSVWPTTVVTD
jgi:hypothetical protein